MILDALFLLFLLFLLLAIAVFVQQWRINRRFTRRLKRKPIALQKHRFSPKPQWVIDAIIKLKVFMPSAGVRTIAVIFNRIYGKRETVSKSFVAKVILQYRYAIAVQRRDMRNHRPVAMPANATWGLDLCGKRDAAGVAHPILGIVDHGSRLLITLNAIANMNFYTLAGHVLLAIGRHGKPESIRTDNAPQLVSKRFRWFLKLISIRHQRSDVGCPWQNGFIERLFGTLKQKLNQVCVEDATQLNFALNTFRDWYNHIRPHQGLYGCTPVEARAWLTGKVSKVPTELFDDRIERTAEPFVAWDGLLTGYRIRWRRP